MIVVVASAADRTARTFADAAAQSIPGCAAAVLTCHDLAVSRTEIRHPGFAHSVVTLGGIEVPTCDIRGVINVLPAVVPQEIVFYPDSEREYQASEFHALLCYLLAVLPCPVLNRPKPPSLTGPMTTPLGWTHLAVDAGIPVRPFDLDSAAAHNPFAAADPASAIDITCLYGRILDPCHGPADTYTRDLGRRAGVDHLRARYVLTGAGHARFVTADTVPDLTSTVVTDALLAQIASWYGQP